MSEQTTIEPDAALEALIERAGRQKVFRRAADYGWNQFDWPPKWVWHGICQEILEGKPMSAPPKSLSEQVLGFSLF